jgi:cysteine desulfurase
MPEWFPGALIAVSTLLQTTLETVARWPFTRRLLRPLRPPRRGGSPAATVGAVTGGESHFDAASGEPLHPAAREAWLAAVDQGWADPARLYREARRARLLLDTARDSVAAAIGARPDETSFTASGTQSLHLGLLGLVVGTRGHPPRVVTSAVEHSAVLHAAQHARQVAGAEVVEVGVDREGLVSSESYVAQLADGHPGGRPVVAALQSANHEVGTVQPVDAVGAAAAERGVPLLVDAAQSAGRMPLPGSWSVLAASAHKWGGPAGVGVLAVRKGTRWRSPSPADEREAGRVAGFEDVPAIVAAAAALEAVTAEAAEEGARLHALVERLRAEVPRVVPDVQVVGHPTLRLPHLMTFSLLYVDGEAVVTELDRAGFAVSSGSSCTASTLTPSHVLAAMGVLTHGNVRVSLARGTAAEEVERFLGVLPALVAGLRDQAGASGL